MRAKLALATRLTRRMPCLRLRAAVRASEETGVAFCCSELVVLGVVFSDEANFLLGLPR